MDQVESLDKKEYLYPHIVLDLAHVPLKYRTAICKLSAKYFHYRE